MTDEPQPKRRWRLSRRGFLIGAGAAGAALLVGVRFGVPAARLQIARILETSTGPAGSAGDAPPDAWFEILADSRVRLHLPKMEMGQGIHTALAQIAVEELEVAWDALDVVHAETARGIDGGVTSASNSVATMYAPVREAAATMREMLRAEAATLLGVAAGELVVEEGVFTAPDGSSITYGEVVQQVNSWEVPEEAPPLKSPADFHTIGQSRARVDLRAKVLGHAVYGYDARVSGMLYGAVPRPPVLGSTLRLAAPGTAATEPGVEQVVIEDGFAGIVARSRAEAQVALAKLEVEWDEGERWQQAQLEEMVTVGNGTGVVIQKEGDATGQLEAAGSNIIAAEYRTPLAAHAHLEPQSALVDVKPEGVTVYVATQGPFAVRSTVADALGRDPEEINVVPLYLGSGLGSKIGGSAAADAARLSQATGKPVHVGWTRTEDMRFGYFRPLTHHLLAGALDANGRISALEHQQASGDVAFGTFPGFVATIMGADFGAYRGAMLSYGIPHRRTVAWRVKLPIATGWWRGLGLLPNTFAVESFMDELAARAGADPLEFRLQHLPEGETGRRMQRLLETVGEMADWGKSSSDRAQGLAVCFDYGTLVAQVAEVGLEAGEIRVHRVWAAIDPGLVINPDGVAAQTQGAITMGLSSTLHEKITVKDGMVEAQNFDKYPLLRNRETPDIKVTVLSSGETPYGVGEPPIGPIAAATANGLFALTGQRLRELPLSL